MNSEKLHDALNYIDEELIEETNRRRQKKPVNKHIVLRALSYAAAVCFFICIIVAVVIMINGNKKHYNAGMIGDDGISDKDILAVTDSIDEEKDPSITQHPTRKPSATSLTSKVPDATLGEPDCTGIPDGGLPHYTISPSYIEKYKVFAEVISVGSETFMCKVIHNKNVHFIENNDVIEFYSGKLTGPEISLLSEKSIVNVTFGLPENAAIFVAYEVERGY